MEANDPKVSRKSKRGWCTTPASFLYIYQIVLYSDVLGIRTIQPALSVNPETIIVPY